MGGQEKINLRLDPGAIEVHQLQADQQKVRRRFALVHRRELARAHLGGDDHIGSEIPQIAEKGLGAPPVDPSGAGGLRLVLPVFNPAPQTGPNRQRNQVGVVISPEPRGAVLKSVNHFHPRVGAEGGEGFPQSLGGALMRGAMGHGQNQNFRLQATDCRATQASSAGAGRAILRSIALPAQLSLRTDQSFAFAHFTFPARPHNIAVRTYGPAHTWRGDGNCGRLGSQSIAHDCALASGVGPLGARHLCADRRAADGRWLSVDGDLPLLSFHPFRNRALRGVRWGRGPDRLRQLFPLGTARQNAKPKWRILPRSPTPVCRSPCWRKLPPPGTWVYWLTVAGPILAEGRQHGYWPRGSVFPGWPRRLLWRGVVLCGLLAWGAGLHKRFKQHLFLAANILLLLMGISYLVRAYFGK